MKFRPNMTNKLAEKIKTLPQTGFHFDEEEHLYLLDGKPLTGVTTILRVLAKPALIQWSADEACKYVQTNLTNIEQLDTVLKEARLAHRKKKEKAGDIGTEAHKLIENWIKGERPLVLDKKTQVGKMVHNFVDWAIENKVEFIESEKRLYSQKHWYAGTVDLVFEMDGKRYIGDIKTSSGIYQEAFYQMGGYEIALDEMGFGKVDGYLVINLKKDGTMDLKVSDNREINKQAFLHCLELYKIINSLE
jgi:hypothetical protein